MKYSEMSRDYLHLSNLAPQCQNLFMCLKVCHSILSPKSNDLFKYFKQLWNFLKNEFFKMFFLETSIVRVAVLTVWKN